MLVSLFAFYKLYLTLFKNKSVPFTHVKVTLSSGTTLIYRHVESVSKDKVFRQ